MYHQTSGVACGNLYLVFGDCGTVQTSSLFLGILEGKGRIFIFPMIEKSKKIEKYGGGGGVVGEIVSQSMNLEGTPILAILQPCGSSM